MAKQVISAGERLITVRDDERAWGLLGQAYLIDKQYAKAAPLLDKFARAHLDSGGAWYNLGVALSRSSQWKPAAEALEKATSSHRRIWPRCLNSGYVYESDKQYDKAMVAYQRAYELRVNAMKRRDQAWIEIKQGEAARESSLDSDHLFTLPSRPMPRTDSDPSNATARRLTSELSPAASDNASPRAAACDNTGNVAQGSSAILYVELHQG